MPCLLTQQIQLARYNDEEYDSLIKTLPSSHDWSREETDYLLSMCERFDLRFIVIADRYEVRGGSAVAAASWSLPCVPEPKGQVGRCLMQHDLHTMLSVGMV
jgi:hypothetical protein